MNWTSQKIYFWQLVEFFPFFLQPKKNMSLNWFQKLQNCIFLYPHLQNYLVSTVCFVKQGEGQLNWTISGVVAFGSFWRIWRPLLDFLSSVKHKRCLEPYFNGIKLNFNQNRSLNATLWCLGTLIYHNFRLASKTPKNF